MYNFMTATFEKVDGSVIKLADIGVNEDLIFSTLSFLDAAKASTKKFDIPGVGVVSGEFSYYTEADLEGTDYEGKPGWFYVDEEANLYPMNNVEVPFGSMFYLQGGDEGDPQIVFSGSVANETTPVDIAVNMYNFTGNCTPVDLTLGDIGVNEDLIFSTLSFLDSAKASTKKFDIPGVGVVSGEFSYYTEADLEGTDYEGKPGWFYVDEEANLYPMNDIEIPAGSMFYLQGGDEGEPQILIPSAL